MSGQTTDCSECGHPGTRHYAIRMAPAAGVAVHGVHVGCEDCETPDIPALAREANRLEEQGHYSLAAKAWERVEIAREEQEQTLRRAAFIDPEVMVGAAEAVMQFISLTDSGFTCDEAGRLEPFIRAVLGDDEADAFHEWHASTDNEDGDCSHEQYLALMGGG